MANVLAFAETRAGEAGKAAREIVSAAHGLGAALGGDVHAAAIGAPGTAAAAAILGEHGAAVVHVAEREDLKLYQPDVFAGALAALIEARGYAAVLFPATAQGKDLAPRVAARLGRGLATDIVGYEVTDGSIVVRRPMYAGKAIARLRFRESPALMSVRANVFPIETHGGAGAVETLPVPDDTPRVRVTGLELGDRERVDVGEATIVVSGGRGMQGPEHWPLLESLVDALGPEAALGASRAVVDAGWRPHAEQVGQTGKTVSPNLYFAIGISGAIQHLAGMRTAKTIVAINRDADAPIFQVADYGIVGDAFEVLPPLADAIRQAREGG